MFIDTVTSTFRPLFQERFTHILCVVPGLNSRFKDLHSVLILTCADQMLQVLLFYSLK